MIADLFDALKLCGEDAVLDTVPTSNGATRMLALDALQPYGFRVSTGESDGLHLRGKVDWRPGRETIASWALPERRLRNPKPFARTEAPEMVEADTVYIVDDDQAIRTALVNLVQSADLHAQSFSSVAAFLENGKEIKAGCLLLDVRLPGVNGLEFLTNMIEHGLRIPTIMITGHGDIPMTVKGMRAGAVDFLTKPFRPSEVLDAISRALEIDRRRRVEVMEHADIVARFKTLSQREKQVMALVTSGKMNKQVAWDLGLSEITVKVHRGKLMKKMQVRTLPDLVRLAEQLASAHSAAPPAVVS